MKHLYGSDPLALQVMDTLDLQASRNEPNAVGVAVEPSPPTDPDGRLNAMKAALGRRIQARRKRRFDTIEAFAKTAGLNPAYAWRIEAGRQNLSLGTLLRVGAALHVTLADLFDGLEGGSRL